MSSNLATRLRTRMEEQKLNARELERLAGLKANAVANILNGSSKKPSADKLYHIAGALSCSMNELLDDSAPPLSSFTAKEWTLAVFISAAEAVDQCIKEKKKVPPVSTILRMINEVYAYSIGREEMKADLIFTRWVVDRNI
jgi:transcriptional regulator with XRE-family HTH domain